jgi:DNA-directed RNA polymerase subunit RPC12/RpoP
VSSERGAFGDHDKKRGNETIERERNTRESLPSCLCKSCAHQILLKPRKKRPLTKERVSASNKGFHESQKRKEKKRSSALEASKHEL